MTCEVIWHGEAVCPYCGHEGGDSWELGDGVDDSGVTECGYCGLEYEWVRQVEYSYETRRLRRPQAVDYDDVEVDEAIDAMEGFAFRGEPAGACPVELGVLGLGERELARGIAARAAMLLTAANVEITRIGLKAAAAEMEQRAERHRRAASVRASYAGPKAAKIRQRHKRAR